MRAAVFSDTHTNTALMLNAVRTLRPDVIIHLGDHERDADTIRMEFPEIPLFVVRGNCDICGVAPVNDIVPLGNVKAFITHGHLYDVKWRGPDSVVYAAMEQGCKIALYGHTHIAENTEIAGIKVMNPGTAGSGRHNTYGYIEVFDNGGIICEIREL